MDRTGEASTRSTASAPKAMGHGWRCTNRLQRYQFESGPTFEREPRRGSANRSTAGPANPSNAGSSVTEATMVSSTAMMALTAMPLTKEMPMMNRPSMEMHTVTPAKRTARPAVVRAVAHASSDDAPSWRHARKRVRMNRA
jgi:hypothetical protein